MFSYGFHPGDRVHPAGYTIVDDESDFQIKDPQIRQPGGNKGRATPETFIFQSVRQNHMHETW